MTGSKIPLPAIILAGPTGSGKTAMSLHLARYLQTEIISMDSRQVYREISVGTGKPGSFEQGQVRHHLIGFRSIRRRYTAFDFYLDSMRLNKKFQARRMIPLYVGGTGLYAKTLREGLFDGPGPDPAFRSELSSVDTSELFRRLIYLDPKVAGIVFPGDRPRILRALEVFHQSGVSILTFQKSHTRPSLKRSLLLVLEMDRERLYKKINKRTDAFFRNGWVEEARGLMKTKSLISGKSDALSILMGTIGYRQIINSFKHPVSEQECLEEVQKHTRRYAKRQMTWFRNTRGAVFIRAGDIQGMLRYIKKYLFDFVY